MREIRFDSAFMFAYSDRDITYAAKRYEDDVPEAIKKRRLREVIDLQEEHTRKAHADRIGQEEEILIHGPAKRGDRLMGRSRRFQNVLLPLNAGQAGDLVLRTITVARTFPNRRLRERLFRHQAGSPEVPSPGWPREKRSGATFSRWGSRPRPHQKRSRPVGVGALPP